MSSPPRRGAWLGALVSTCLTVAAFAQDTAVPNPAAVAAARGADRPTTARPEPDAAERRLPADVTTRHVLELPGRTLRFAATAASIRLADPQGQPQADIAVIDYQLQTDQPANQRPVTFVLNGGPGASSAWLHLGALGPWRLPMAGDAALPSAPPQSCRMPRPGSTSPTWSSSIRSALATAASRGPARSCAGASGRSRATSSRWPRSYAAGWSRTAASAHRSSWSARAMAAFAGRGWPARSSRTRVSVCWGSC